MKLGKRCKRFCACMMAVLMVCQMFWGTGIELKAAESERSSDETKIQAAIVDNKGNRLSGIECQLIDASASNDVIATLVSGDDGMVYYSVSELQSGQYCLKVPFAGTHISKPSKGFTYTVENGKIIEIDSNEYTGTEKIEFVLTPIDEEPEVSQPDKETLIINMKDDKGRAFNEKIFVLVDSQFPNSEGQTIAPENGVLKIKLNDENLENGEIRIKSSLAEQYVMTPQTIKFTAESKVFTTVNSEAYDGTKTFTMTVVKNETSSEEKAEITELKLSSTNLSSDGGEITLEVSGKKLASNVEVKVIAPSASIKTEVSNILNTDTLQKYTINVPENTDKEEQRYMITCMIKGDILSTEYIEFVVAGKKEDVQEEDTSDVVIESVEVVPGQVSAIGGEVQLKLSGTGLTADNWDVHTEVYIYTDVSMTDRYGKVIVKDKTENGATLVIPANALKNDAEYHIGVGAKKKGGVDVQKTVKVYQPMKEASVKVDPKQVELAEGNTIVATMAQNVKFGFDDIDTVKNKIYIADFETGANRINLTANDTVQINENVITITFEELPGLKITSALYMEEGAFRTEDNVNLKTVSWLITSKPMITGIELKEDILDNKGGLVEGVLKGVRLNEVSNITAKIMCAGSIEATNIPVTLGEGAEPAISFEVPANNTELTQSYIIDLTMGDTPVYVQAVVSVLSEGASKTEQTLSALTISGNNKLDSGNSLTDITVKVSPQVGELKTRLNVYGTNLDSTKTEVRAIDQYGIVWPVYHIPE